MTAERCARNDGAQSLSRLEALLGLCSLAGPVWGRAGRSAVPPLAPSIGLRPDVSTARPSDRVGAGSPTRGLRQRQRVVEHAMACASSSYTRRAAGPALARETEIHLALRTQPIQGMRRALRGLPSERPAERLARPDRKGVSLYTTPGEASDHIAAVSGSDSAGVPAAPLARCTRNCSNVAAR